MEAVARLRKNGGSARKTRLVADLIRGLSVEKALAMLKFTRKRSALPMEKLLLSAISNWRDKNPDKSLEGAGLYVKAVRVDAGTMLKRFRPAPYGRAHRIRKRSNHVTIVVDSKFYKDDVMQETPVIADTEEQTENS